VSTGKRFLLNKQGRDEIWYPGDFYCIYDSKYCTEIFTANEELAQLIVKVLNENEEESQKKRILEKIRDA